MVGAVGAAAMYSLLQVLALHGAVRVVATPIILVMVLFLIGGAVVAAILGWLMRLMRAVRLRTYVGVPVLILLLWKWQSVWLLMREAVSSEKVPQWELPLQLCATSGTESLSGLPLEMSMLAVAGLTYWAIAFRAHITDLRDAILARPAVSSTATLFWGCVLGVLLWESFAYRFDANSVSVATAKACREWMIESNAISGTTTTVPAVEEKTQ